MGGRIPSTGGRLAFWGSQGKSTGIPTTTHHHSDRGERAFFLLSAEWWWWVVGARLLAYGAVRRCSALIAVTTDLGHRRGLHRALIVASALAILHRARRAGRGRLAYPHDAGGAPLAAKLARLLQMRCAGASCAHRYARHHHGRRRRAHHCSRVRATELDLFFCSFQFAKRALSRGLRSQSVRMHRFGEAAAVEEMFSCARSAQLDVYSVHSHAAVRAHL